MSSFQKAQSQEKIQQQVSSALAKAQEPLTRDQVAEIIKEVIGSVEADIAGTDVKFYREIEALARYIRTAKMEIAAIKPKDITAEHIPAATDQLDAVVGATEEATNKIMDECDQIGGIAGNLSPETNEQLTACITRIYEACNFQDLTGQRITKVVTALKHIEEKIQALLAALGEEIGSSDTASPPVGNNSPVDSEKALLNGPQLPGEGVSQDEIDKLFG